MEGPKGQKQERLATPTRKGSAPPRSTPKSASKSFFNAQSLKKRTSIYRSKQYLQQACDAARKACQSYHQTMAAVTTSYMHQKQNNISIFQSEWVGARALYGVCLYHLEQEKEESNQQSKGQKLAHSSLKTVQDKESITSASNHDSEEKTSKARRILDELVEEIREKSSQERSNTVLSGRAGALQAIFWIRRQLEDPYWSQEAVIELTKQIVQGGILPINSEVTITTEDTTHSTGPESPSTASGLPGRQSYRHGNFRPPKLPKIEHPREGAMMGQIGILHTLLNLTEKEWNMVEKQLPGSKQIVQTKLDSMTVPLLKAKHPKDPPLPCINWAHGATSLALLHIRASQVFQSKSYLLEALNTCEAIIWPKISGEEDSDTEEFEFSPADSTRRQNKSGSATSCPPPMGLAKGTTGMAFVFLALAEYCPKPISTLWLRRAEFLARMALEQSSFVTSSSPTSMDVKASSNFFSFDRTKQSTKDGFPLDARDRYSLYHGQGGLATLLLQLQQPEEKIHMPFYSMGYSNDWLQPEDQMPQLKLVLDDIPDEALAEEIQEKIQEEIETCDSDSEEKEESLDDKFDNILDIDDGEMEVAEEEKEEEEEAVIKPVQTIKATPPRPKFLMPKFQAQTNNSLFWSLQNDTNVGESETYTPAFVNTTADSPEKMQMRSYSLTKPRLTGKSLFEAAASMADDSKGVNGGVAKSGESTKRTGSAQIPEAARMKTAMTSDGSKSTPRKAKNTYPEKETVAMPSPSTTAQDDTKPDDSNLSKSASPVPASSKQKNKTAYKSSTTSDISITQLDETITTDPKRKSRAHSPLMKDMQNSGAAKSSKESSTKKPLGKWSGKGISLATPTRKTDWSTSATSAMPNTPQHRPSNVFERLATPLRIAKQAPKKTPGQKIQRTRDSVPGSEGRVRMTRSAILQQQAMLSAASRDIVLPTDGLMAISRPEDPPREFSTPSRQRIATQSTQQTLIGSGAKVRMTRAAMLKQKATSGRRGGSGTPPKAKYKNSPISQTLQMHSTKETLPGSNGRVRLTRSSMLKQQTLPTKRKTKEETFRNGGRQSKAMAVLGSKVRVTQAAILKQQQTPPNNRESWQNSKVPSGKSSEKPRESSDFPKDSLRISTGELPGSGAQVRLTRSAQLKMKALKPEIKQVMEEHREARKPYPPIDHVLVPSNSPTTSVLGDETSHPNERSRKSSVKTAKKHVASKRANEKSPPSKKELAPVSKPDNDETAHVQPAPAPEGATDAKQTEQIADSTRISRKDELLELDITELQWQEKEESLDDLLDDVLGDEEHGEDAKEEEGTKSARIITQTKVLEEGESACIKAEQEFAELKRKEEAQGARFATEKRAVEEAEATRVSTGNESACIAAKAKAVEETEAARIATEKSKAETFSGEKQAARIAAETKVKEEAQRMAAEKNSGKEAVEATRKASEEAEAMRFAAEAADAAEAARIASETKATEEAERLSTEKKAVEAVEAARIQVEKDAIKAARIAAETKAMEEAAKKAVEGAETTGISAKKNAAEAEAARNAAEATRIKSEKGAEEAARVASEKEAAKAAEAVRIVEEKEEIKANYNAEKLDAVDEGATSMSGDQKKRAKTAPLSEATKRQNMIHTELNGMIDEMMDSEDFEDEDEMDPESYDPLMQAAKEICYTRKYYDVSADRIVFFPSVTKTIINSDLFEKAEEYYFDEDDEFPSDYSVGLRAVAFERIFAQGNAGGDDDEMDDDMMERLSMAVELRDNDLDELKGAFSAAEKADRKGAEEESSNDQIKSPLETISESIGYTSSEVAVSTQEDADDNGRLTIFLGDFAPVLESENRTPEKVIPLQEAATAQLFGLMEAPAFTEQSNSLGREDDDSFVPESLRDFLEDANSKLDADLSDILSDDLDQTELDGSLTIRPGVHEPISEYREQIELKAIEYEEPFEATAKPEVSVSMLGGLAFGTETVRPEDSSGIPESENQHCNEKGTPEESSQVKIPPSEADLTTGPAALTDDQLSTSSKSDSISDAQVSAPFGAPTTLPRDFLRFPTTEEEGEEDGGMSHVTEQPNTIGEENFVPESLRSFLEDVNSKLETDVSGILGDDTDQADATSMIRPSLHAPLSESADHDETKSAEHEMPKPEVPVPKLDDVALGTEAILPEDSLQVPESEDQKYNEAGTFLLLEQVPDQAKLTTPKTEPVSAAASTMINDDQLKAPASAPFGTPTTLPDDFLRVPDADHDEYDIVTPAESLESMLQCIDTSIVNEIEAMVAILGEDAVLPRSRSTTSEVELLDELEVAEDSNKMMGGKGTSIANASSFDELLNGFSFESDQESSKAAMTQISSVAPNAREVDGHHATASHGIRVAEIRRRKPEQGDNQDGATHSFQNKGRKKSD
ncbi:MAG: hypothetical protein SGBAC_005814 [Bacillariaceae sp.]